MAKRQVRCAVYTRKSTDEGLEQAFNSLDAQREACAAYVASQRHEGWALVKNGYDDGGFSGGSMERPGLRRLLADVQAGQVDVIVVYKVDRLTRSLADFAKIVEILDARGASFVSVTQAFNTTTSMGRLTLNVLLSFAQFEREVTGERIRDKIAASKAKGMWMGGPVPLGYRVENRKLLVDEADAITVRHIFQRYLDLGSGRALLDELRAAGYRTKLRTYTDGSTRGGIAFERGTLFALLANRVYRGETVHKGVAMPGEHDAIIEQDLWDRVQATIAANKVERRRGANLKQPSLLAGIIVDGLGRDMSPSHAVKGSRRYRYYITHGSRIREGDPAAWRMPAHDVEVAVMHRLKRLLLDRAAIGKLVTVHTGSAAALIEAIAAADRCATRLDAAATQRIVVGALVRQVRVEEKRLVVTVNTAAVMQALTIEPSHEHADLILTAPATRMRCRKDVKLLLTTERGAATSKNGDLIALLREARDAQRLMLASPALSVRAMAAEHQRCSTRLGKLLRLGWLAPSIVERITTGEHPVRLTPRRLLDANLPACWNAQQRLINSL